MSHTKQLRFSLLFRESTLCIIKSFWKEIYNDVENLLGASFDLLIEYKKWFPMIPIVYFGLQLWKKGKSLSVCFFSNWYSPKKIIEGETPPP